MTFNLYRAAVKGDTKTSVKGDNENWVNFFRSSYGILESMEKVRSFSTLENNFCSVSMEKGNNFFWHAF